MRYLQILHETFGNNRNDQYICVYLKSISANKTFLGSSNSRSGFVSAEMLKAGLASIYVAKGAQYAGMLDRLKKYESRAK